ncbi:MAG: hypothetical protein V1495_04190 [Pseudomonadota bacterium]
MRVSNRWILGLFLCWTLLQPLSARAIERAGAIGLSFADPVRLKPTVGRGDALVGIDLSYFMEEQWAMLLNFNIGLTGSQRMGLGVGPKLFIFPEATLNPYFIPRFLYHLSPRNEFGWNFAAGAEWNLRALTGMDNLALIGEIGISQIVWSGTPNLLSLELIRVGLSWNF